MSSVDQQLEQAGGEHPAHGIHVPHGDPGEVHTHGHSHGDSIHLPKPTAWPIVLAFGFTLLVGGVLTHWGISVLGAVLLIIACVGWFRQVLPHEDIEHIDVELQEISVLSSRKSVARITIGEDHRAHLPLQTFPMMAGVKGGIAGGIAMIVPALAYGLIAKHSLWYTVNLLGGAGTAMWEHPTEAQLMQFHAPTVLFAILIHAMSCVLIGLLYGALLPLAPKRPVLLGGIIAPILWSALLYATLPTINPMLAQHINWAAFLISQFTFGIVAGLVVARSPYIRTAQSLPLAMRLGLEASGLTHHDGEDRH